MFNTSTKPFTNKKYIISIVRYCLLRLIYVSGSVFSYTLSPFSVENIDKRGEFIVDTAKASAMFIGLGKSRETTTIKIMIKSVLIR